MPSPCSPPWGWGPAGRRRPGPDPDLRVSDAERTEVADRLSKHYGDGRLDQDEFNERLERAMIANTHADLSGLLDDLPDDQPAANAARQRPRRPSRPILFVLLVIVLAVSVGHLLFHPFFFVPVPWLFLGLVAFLLLRRRSRYRGGQGPR